MIKKNKILLFIIVIISCKSSFAQITSSTADSSLGLSYYADTAFFKDTVITGDTIYYYNDSIHFDSIASPGRLILKDTIYTNDTLYYLKQENDWNMEIDALVFFFPIPFTIISNSQHIADTVFFYNNAIYFDSLNSIGYDTPSDSIYTSTQSYYLKGSKCWNNSINDSVYCIIASDTFSFNYYNTITSDTFYYEYANISFPDSLFVFNMDQKRSDTALGKLTATHPMDCTICDFSWTKYDTSSLDFTIPISTENGVSSSVIEDLTNGGYKVVITNNGKDTAFYAWIYNNYLRISLDTITKENNLLDEAASQLWCKGLKLFSETFIDSFYYYDHYEDTSIFLEKDISYLWKGIIKENGETADDIPFSGKKTANASVRDKQSTMTNEMPHEDTYFVLEATDEYGIKSKDSVLFESIIPHADFEAYYKGSKAEEDEPYEKADRDNISNGSSPLKTIFINTSENAYSFKWYFDDDYVEKDYITKIGYTGQEQHDTSHVYYIPGTYSVKLIAYHSDYQSCTDTLEAEMFEVLPSKIDELPNVFTPNEDGFNDFFKIKEDNYNSLKYFEILIFNSVGKKIYEFKGDINEWEGWDGKIKDSNRMAESGIYYFYIKATGWEEDNAKVYDGEDYAGFLYLFTE